MLPQAGYLLVFLFNILRQRTAKRFINVKMLKASLRFIKVSHVTRSQGLKFPLDVVFGGDE